MDGADVKGGRASPSADVVTPVLMCGGSGTRLWPMSRKSYPKQFTALLGQESLFQASARRVIGHHFAPPLVITNADFRFIVTEQLAEIGVEAGPILIEPEGRNTAPAILAASMHMHEQDPDALLLVLPTDHVMPDRETFLSAVDAGLERARSGDLVTFAIRPDRPETGFGYMELADAADREPVAVRRFVEKPAPAQAETLLASGRCFWNAGLFLFAPSAMIEAFATHAPDLIGPVRSALAFAHRDLGFLRLATRPWSAVVDISIDYAILEHSDRVVAVPYRGTWSDMGNWDTVWTMSEPDAQGVAAVGEAHAVDCRNVLLRSESDSQVLVGLGLQDIIAIAMPDAVLVADKARVQDVKHAVSQLKAGAYAQAEAFPREHRPWGHFERLTTGPGFEVRRITVNPGAALSLQSHTHRAEHWIVVVGQARVTLDGADRILDANQSVYIPPDCRHGLANPGPERLILVEVQTGTSFGDDDVVRYP